MNRPRAITKRNLKKLCWQRGISVKELAGKIGKARETIYRAVNRPKQFRPTYRDICEALNVQI